jgi:hypothetical protein
MAYAQHLRRLQTYVGVAFRRWKLVVTHTNLPPLPTAPMDAVDKDSRNLVGPRPRSTDASNDDYLLEKICAENETQDALRLSFQRCVRACMAA